MAFNVPTFNIQCNLWHQPHVPPAAPDVVSDCNLALGRRGASAQGLYTSDHEPVMSLLLPPGTDIRGPQCVSGSDLVEVPAGTRRFYKVIGVDDSGKGFPNEHRVGFIAWDDSIANWPSPIP